MVFISEHTHDKTSIMETRIRSNRLRGVIGICVLLALTGIVYLGYFCPDHVCALTNRDIKESTRLSEGFSTGTGLGSLASSSPVEPFKNSLLIHSSFKFQNIQSSLGYDDILNNDTFQFDINAHDVIVFLHIQKTGKYFYLFFKLLLRNIKAN